ncbi:hypothetical protein ACFE04_012037 [Oxalis oulophora]
MSTSASFSRKLLLHNPLDFHRPEELAVAPAPNNTDNGSFDSHIIMIIAVLLIVLICSITFYFLIRCILSCSMTLIAVADQSTKKIDQGVEKQTLKNFTVVKYKNHDNSDVAASLSKECVICITEFVTGDKVKILPKCNHGFHVKCVDKWLKSHSSCPTCRQSLNETSCENVVVRCHNNEIGLGSENVHAPVDVATLEPESLLNY